MRKYASFRKTQQTIVFPKDTKTDVFDFKEESRDNMRIDNVPRVKGNDLHEHFCTFSIIYWIETRGSISKNKRY